MRVHAGLSICAVVTLCRRNTGCCGDGRMRVGVGIVVVTGNPTRPSLKGARESLIAAVNGVNESVFWCLGNDIDVWSSSASAKHKADPDLTGSIASRNYCPQPLLIHTRRALSTTDGASSSHAARILHQLRAPFSPTKSRVPGLVHLPFSLAHLRHLTTRQRDSIGIVSTKTSSAHIVIPRPLLTTRPILKRTPQISHNR